MSEFMKSIVEDVLKRSSPVTASTVSEKKKEVAPERRTMTSSAANQPKNSTVVLQSLHRPNYQRQKKNDHLYVKKGDSPITVKQNPPAKKQSEVNKPNNLAQLTIASIGKGREPVQHPSKGVASSGTARKEKSAQLIGKTKNNFSVWYFPQIHSQMQPLLKGKVHTTSVGVVSGIACNPGILFLVNEILHEFSGLKHHIEWDRSPNGKFHLELYLQDEKCLLQALNKIYQSLNRHAMIRLEAYTAFHPSAWLLQQLKLDSSYNAIGLLEGLSFYDNMGLVDRYVTSHPDTSFTYKIEEGYVVLMGDNGEISTAVQALKKEASSYLNF